ncbi:hypothetical protein HIM_06824 [Hirsutella minnesotensis 3608]|uniref:MARVEL domain-containing protein n=1 Tax=Hirsutella minnesotensis 3608 TaxID=1043627 RepID=A0A0F7ZIH6_9HYPO|nr:hypothetical protein HIM_06824 [Hirsutella minnesotensis 3608]
MTNSEAYGGSDRQILRTPIWILGLRIAQVVLSIIVLALAATAMRDAYLDELGLVVATSIITWIIVVYAIVSERVAPCRVAYHVVAVLSLEAFLVILWLATFAAVAAQRGRFVSLNSCTGSGCLRKRVVLSGRGLDAMSGAAGLGALVWLLFIATFVWTLLQFINGRKQGRFPINTAGGRDTVLEDQTAPKGVLQQQVGAGNQSSQEYPGPRPL